MPIRRPDRLRVSILRRTWNADALQEKQPHHWLLVLFFTLLGFYASLWLSRFDWWQQASFGAYDGLVSMTPARTTRPSHTAVVLIDDDDYWRGEWARRQPLKRRTLAKLLRTLQADGARAIGIDVDLRCQTPDGRVNVHGDYRDETAEFFAAVTEVARTTPVVFPKTVAFDEGLDRFVIDADSFDGFQFGPGAMVSCGYTRLPHDLRQVALNAAPAGIKLDSFAGMITRVEPMVGEPSKPSQATFPFVRSFLSKASFNGALFSAGQVLTGDRRASRGVANKIVIVGGGWHRDAWKRGEPIDEHMTPRGLMPGALIHANYVEAMMSEQLTSPSGEWLHIVFDLTVGFGLAAIFACAVGYWKIMYLAGLAVVVCLVSLLAWTTIGTFVDAVPPLILLSGHAAVDKILGWKRKADLYDAAEVAA